MITVSKTVLAKKLNIQSLEKKILKLQDYARWWVYKPNREPARMTIMPSSAAIVYLILHHQR